MRIYLPATLADLVAPGPLSARLAYAATPELMQRVPDEDEEGWEFIAFLAAAEAAIDTAIADGARSRILLAADIDAPADSDVDPDGLAGTVRAPAVGWKKIVSVHVDDLSDAALAADLAAAGTDPQARERLGDADLLWYDVSERAAVAQLLAP